LFDHDLLKKLQQLSPNIQEFVGHFQQAEAGAVEVDDPVESSGGGANATPSVRRLLSPQVQCVILLGQLVRVTERVRLIKVPFEKIAQKDVILHSSRRWLDFSPEAVLQNLVAYWQPLDLDQHGPLASVEKGALRDNQLDALIGHLSQMSVVFKNYMDAMELISDVLLLTQQKVDLSEQTLHAVLKVMVGYQGKGKLDDILLSDMLSCYLQFPLFETVICDFVHHFAAIGSQYHLLSFKAGIRMQAVVVAASDLTVEAISTKQTNSPGKPKGRKRIQLSCRTHRGDQVNRLCSPKLANLSRQLDLHLHSIAHVEDGTAIKGRFGVEAMLKWFLYKIDLLVS
jgi:hypothetical protein